MRRSPHAIDGNPRIYSKEVALRDSICKEGFIASVLQRNGMVRVDTLFVGVP